MSDGTAFTTLPEVTTTSTQTPTAPYAVREIRLTFQFASGEQLVISGLRAIVHVEFAAQPTTGLGQIRVFGMTLDHMNRLSRAGFLWQSDQNYVAVEAGDKGSNLVTVFKGLIIEAYPDMRGMPQTAFFVLANPSDVIQLKPVEPTSFAGETPAPTAIKTIAEKAGLTLENNNVNAVFSSPYFHGTAWDQLITAVRAANCFGFLDGITKTFAIWPKTGWRESGGTPEISPATGMIGYPEFQAANVVVRTIFDASIKPGVGTLVRVKSQLAAADGLIVVTNVNYDLTSEMPDGPWETTIVGVPQTFARG